MAKLKVFRTPIGFHDAYVAAPSRKAALAAWGADKDLFARGAAEEVTDLALTEGPLATPGEVVKVSRGDREAQLSALADERPTATTAKARPNPKPRPKPSRAALDHAEQAFAAAEARHEAALAEIAAQEAALERRKRELKEANASELARLTRAHAQAERAYREALADWRSVGA